MYSVTVGQHLAAGKSLNKAAAPFVADAKRLKKDFNSTVAQFARRFVKEMT
jgi:hypothetical protein